MPGYVRVYRWNLELHEQVRLDLGAVMLARGVPVTGKVVDRTSPIGNVEVELAPEGTLPSAEEARRNRVQSLRTITNRRGLYKFADIGPGTYAAYARKEGFSSAALRRLKVATEQIEPDTILLHPLTSISLFVNPPVDYNGKPWQVRLHRAVPQSVHQQLARLGSTTFGGEWVASLLDVGFYRLEIATAAGNAVASRQLDLQQDTMLNIEIDSIPVQGQLTVGGHPTSGSITLASEAGSRATFRVDDKGGFTGMLPHEGLWRASITCGSPLNHINVPEVRVKRKTDNTAEINIDLPGGTLQGNVIDEAGKPVRAALLLFNNHRLEGTMQADENGEFRFDGLAKGSA